MRYLPQGPGVTALKPLTPKQARLRAARGALLVDVRERHEHNAEHIAGSRNAPLTEFPGALDTGGWPAIYYCNSGRRTALNAARLAAAAPARAYVLKGGLIAWKAAGLPVEGGGTAALAGASLLSQMLAAYGRKTDT